MNDTKGKLFITANQLEEHCWDFARELFGHGYDFDIIAGITRGGAQISIYMQEVFGLLSGKKKGFAAIHAQSYTEIGKAGEVHVGNIDMLLELVEKGSSILIVDDIFDRGKTFKAVYDKVTTSIRQEDVSVKIAALYYKPENNVVDIKPDYHYKIFRPNDWIVLPHELEQLSKEELVLKGFSEV